MKLYHIVRGEDAVNSVKKYGILSPRLLFSKDRKLFHKIVFKNYISRTSTFLNKSPNKITDEDIINFLDNCPRRIPATADALFFNIISLREMHKNIISAFTPCIELIIDSNILKNYRPILFEYRQPKKYIDWTFIESEDFRNSVINGSKKLPQKGLVFKYVPHIAVNCNAISFKNINNFILIEQYYRYVSEKIINSTIYIK